MTDERAQGKPFNDPNQPGRLDVDGIEWWVCDPYPTWYRREDGKLRTKASPRWARFAG